jgi:hypothetical protein
VKSVIAIFSPVFRFGYKKLSAFPLIDFFIANFGDDFRGQQ